MEITRPLLELLTLQEGLIRRSQLLEGPLRIASPARAVADAARQARSEARTRPSRCSTPTLPECWPGSNGPT